MKKIMTLLCLLCGIGMGARADEAFRQHRYDTFKVEPITENSIVFVGNSISDMHLWAEAFGNDPRIVNRGNSGGKSDEILANVRSYCVGKPAKIFLLIGINDLHAGVSTYNVVSNIQRTIDTIKEVSPSTKIYVQSVLPSTYAPMSNIQDCNAQLQALLTDTGYEDVTYIDIHSLLYGKVNTDTSGRYSFDALHLTAAGYSIWTRELEKYITDCNTVYPENTLSLQNNGGLTSSFGARATYFSMMPVTSNDVLFFGDEMVKNGEWNELLRNYNVKNRGTNWDYDQSKYATIENTRSGIKSTFATISGVEKVAPKQILLYTGTGEVNGSASVNNVFNSYKTLITLIRQYAPASDTKISLVSLMPTRTAGNSRVKMFNNLLKEYVAQEGATQNLEYIDIYTTLATASDNVVPSYFPAGNNYLYGEGYIAVANVLAGYIEGCDPVTPEQAANYRALIENAGNGEVNEGLLWTGNINHSDMPWMRIPAIVKTHTGDLLAFADYRYNHDDIGRNNGLNNGRIDIQMRRSTNGGETWGNIVTVAHGSGEYNAVDAGYGDAAVVADNGGTDRVLLLAATGSINYGNSSRSNPLRMAKFTSDDNGHVWSAPTDMTETFYGLLPAGVRAAFSTSGRVEQSVFRKEDASFNRIYNPLCTTAGNFVLYSDDFGDTWGLLGGTCAQNSGDEAHVVELPNGDILLVSRQASGDGRYINLFTYNKDEQGNADFAKGGAWDANGYRNNSSAARCNGDIDIVNACPADFGDPVKLLIQTAPYYSGPRRQVSYHYRELPAPDANGDYSLMDFTSGWTAGLQVSDKASAYSSIVSIDHATEAILFEESENEVYGTNDPYAYNIIFKKHTIEEITKGAYVSSTPEQENPGPETAVLSSDDSFSVSHTYDLHGRRLQQAQKGLCVVNNKKTVR